MAILLRLLIGSHLYGTAHEGSDFDWYEVHHSIRSGQTLEGDVDTTRFSLGEFMRQADKGVPQALEVMFSPVGWPEVDKLEALRLGFRVNLAQAANTYERTIRAFHRAKPTPKRLAHAQRLSWQREQLIRYGRFDPTDLTWRQ